MTCEHSKYNTSQRSTYLSRCSTSRFRRSKWFWGSSCTTERMFASLESRSVSSLPALCVNIRSILWFRRVLTSYVHDLDMGRCGEHAAGENAEPALDQVAHSIYVGIMVDGPFTYASSLIFQHTTNAKSGRLTLVKRVPESADLRMRTSHTIYTSQKSLY